MTEFINPTVSVEVERQRNGSAGIDRGPGIPCLSPSARAGPHPKLTSPAKSHDAIKSAKSGGNICHLNKNHRFSWAWGAASPYKVGLYLAGAHLGDNPP